MNREVEKMRRLLVALIAIVILASLAITAPAIGCAKDAQTRTMMSGALIAPPCNANGKRDASHGIACFQTDAPGPPAEVLTTATVMIDREDDEESGNGQDSTSNRQIILSSANDCTQKICENVTILPLMRSAGPPVPTLIFLKSPKFGDLSLQEVLFAHQRSHLSPFQNFGNILQVSHIKNHYRFFVFFTQGESGGIHDAQPLLYRFVIRNILV